MKYSELAEIYEKLQEVSAKLKKTEIISNLLKKTPSKLLPKVVRLIRGSVFSGYSEEELGVADKLMIRAISKAYGIETKDIVKKFKEIGDLGLCSEYFNKIKKQRTLRKKDLTIDDVFEDIQKISKQSGAGSQEKKLSIISGLLAQSKPKESKYIVRTILGQLRVGVAAGIIRDSIAKAFDIESKDVEAAFSLFPDYGELAEKIKERGKSALKDIKVKIGKPTKVMLAIKSPDLETALKNAKSPVLEFKYDGMRAQIQKQDDKIWIFTRRLENVTNQFPDLVKLAKEGIKSNKCIVEGEVLAINPKTKKPLPFQKLSQRIQRKYDIDKMKKEIPVQLNLFDIVYLNGKSLINKKLRERIKILEKIIKPIKGKFQIAKRIETSNLKRAKKFYKDALSKGHEGIIVKNLNAKYKTGRHVGYWWKVKPTLENLDLTIIGATWGTGKRAGWLGSLILGCKKDSEFLPCGMLGTGVKEKEGKGVTFKELTKMLRSNIIKEKGNKVKIKPKIVIEVAYEEIQKSPNYKSGYALRFPRFIRLRPDKSIKEVDSLSRIKRLYNIQKGKTRK